MSIRLRVSILAALVLSIGVGITSVLVVMRLSRQLREITIGMVREEASYLARTVSEDLATRNLDHLTGTVEAVAGDEIREVYVTDSKGTILAGSNRLHEGIVQYARNAILRNRVVVGPVRDTTTAAVPVRNKGKTIGAVVLTLNTERTRRGIDSIRTTAIQSGLAATIIGLVAIYLLMSYFTAPLASLLQAIRRIASGDYDSRVTPPSTPELRQIADAFNNMAIAVTRRIRNLELINEMAAQVTRAERMSEVAKAIWDIGAVVLDAELRLWTLTDYGEKLQSVPAPGAGRRITAGPTCPVMRAVRASRPVVIGDQPDAEIPSQSRVSTGLEPADAAVIVPLLSSEGTVGAISIEMRNGRRIISREHVYTATAMAGLIAPAVSSRIRMESQARSARMLQQMLVPGPPAAISGTDIAYFYRPAEEVTRMGGDYYDFIPLPDNRWCLTIGDVSGKGLPAAQYTAMVKYVLRSYIIEYASPSTALSRTNMALATQLRPEAFITLFCGILDLKACTLQYANAGHMPPLLYSARTDSVRQLTSSGVAAGVFENVVFEEKVDTVKAGDVLMLFTDGVTEAHTAQEMYGDERLMNLLQTHAHSTAQEIIDEVVQDLLDFTGGRLRDDAALVVVRVE